MDIHKPKPWHGVREFLKEYVIIVVGVLTALGAEQVAEWLHWREQVALADEALTAEVQVNLNRSYQRIVVAACQRDRLAELRDLLLKPGPAWKGVPVVPSTTFHDPPKSELEKVARLGSTSYTGADNASAIGSVYLTPSAGWPEAAWSSAVASGVFNHMDRQRAATFGRLYRTFERLRDQQQAEQPAKARLAVLAYDRTLTEAEKNDFIQTLGALNAANVGMEIAAAQLLLDADKNGLRIKASDAKATLDEIAASPRVSCYRPVKIPLAPG